MWFTLGFGTACMLCVFGLCTEAGYGFAALGLSLLLLLCCRRFPAMGVGVLALLGLCAGIFWYSTFQKTRIGPVSGLDETTRCAELRLSDFSQETTYGRSADGVLTLNGRAYPVRIYLEASDADLLTPGTVLQGDFLFRLTTPGGKRESSAYAGKGIFLLAYQKGDLQISRGEGVTLREWASGLRFRIKGILAQCLEADVYPFAGALLLGDTSRLSYEMDTQLKISGIRHVAAVSGLHVSILFTMVSMVTFRKRYLTVLAGFPVLFLFAALAGFTPSVTRACIMSGLMLLALLLNREYDGATALSFAVLTMLVINPLSAASVSLQLSVASVAGIYLMQAPIQSWLLEKLGKPRGKGLCARLKRWLAASVSVSLSAMLLTTPLCAWYFGTVSLIGVVTNLLTLWLISLVFYGLMALCAVSYIHTGTAMILGKGARWLIRLVLGIAGYLSRVPLACLYTASIYTTAWLMFAYALLIVFAISRKKRPGLLSVCAALGLCLALLCSWTEPMLSDTVITVLDVGQGQCILLQSEGRHYMVDCGGDSDAAAADTAAEYLLSRGIYGLDGLILTHMDRDHAGGAEFLLSRIPADVVILPPVANDLDGKNARILYADRELDLAWSSSTLRIFGENIRESANENSLCILLDTEKCDILITGDRNASGEEALLEAVSLPKVDVLVAGHHGSKYASSRQLLEAVQPRIVCISAGRNNSSGHPAAETLKRLAEYGCRIYRTDIHGNITIRR